MNKSATAVYKVLQENKSLSMGKAMIQAGYSKSYSRQPSILENSKSWQKLISKYLPDDKLLETHSQALDALKDKQPDHQSRLKAVELAYKLKGRIGNEGITVNSNAPLQIVFKRDKIGSK